MEYTRQHLIDLCEAGLVPQDKWRDRDSASSQQRLGEAWALLRAGCDFTVRVKPDAPRDRCVTDEGTIWIDISYRGFQSFEYGDTRDSELFYIPTQKRLDERAGEDWY